MPQGKAMALMRFLSVMLMASLCWGTALAQAQGASDMEGDKKAIRLDDAPEYGGVVVDQTLTAYGHYFYGKFSEGWREQSDADSYVLSVREKPSPRGGTEVLIYSNETVVFRAVLPRGFGYVANLSSMVVESGLQAALFGDPDLAKSAF
jgi:curli production assembly/transport component CsgE